jgi:hypothetical protein
LNQIGRANRDYEILYCLHPQFQIGNGDRADLLVKLPRLLLIRRVHKSLIHHSLVLTANVDALALLNHKDSQ